MREDKMLAIMAGALQDAQAVVDCIWAETDQPMAVLKNVCHLRELAPWHEYSVTVVPFLLNLTETKPHPETRKYVGKSYGSKARLYVDLFSMLLFSRYAEQYASGMRDDAGSEETTPKCTEKTTTENVLETEEA